MIATHEDLTNVIAGANIGIWSWDLVDNTIIWDLTMHKIFGTDPKTYQTTYENFLKILHPDDVNEVQQNSIDLFKKQVLHFTNTYRIILPDKTIRYILSKTSTHTDNNNTIIRMIGMSQDITQQKQYEYALQKNDRTYHLILNYITDGWWEFDIKNKQLHLSKSSKDFLGYNDHELMNPVNKWKSMINHEDYFILKKSYYAHLKHNTKIETIIRFVHKNGNVIWAIVRGTSSRDLFSDKVSLIGTFTNITKLKNTEQELINSNKELDDFANIASHDLREPLRGINNYCGFLQEDYHDKIDSEGQNKLSTLQKLTKRLDKFLDTLLLYSQIGRTQLALTMVDINKVLSREIDSLQITIKEKNINIMLMQNFPKIYCDNVRIGEIFHNLIVNAVKYTDNRAPTIEIGFKPLNPVVFYVRDNGIGIEEKHFTIIFKIFKRLHAREAFGGGTGSGLTIAKKIIERHNGKIWLESEIGTGSTFYFTLG